MSYPNNNTIFNMFNYKKCLNNKRIIYIFKANYIEIKKKNTNIFYKFKNYVDNRINNYKSKKYLKVFIMGNKNELDSDLKTIYKDLGIIHLLSISGSYISILLLILNKLIKNKKIIVIFLLFYIVFTNFQISIIRSSLCYILFLINYKYKFNYNTKDIIIFLASILLFLNPYYIYDIGYLLSFIVSYSLIYFKDSYIYKKAFVKSIYISCISFLSSLPIIINTYYSINFLSIIYNLFYVPFSTLVLYPLSFLTFFIPVLDKVMVQFINLFENISYYLSNIKIFTLSFSKIPILLILFYYLLLFYKNKYICFLIIVFYFYNYFIFIPRIYFIDVGQGDSALIRFGNKNVLIDTGGKYDYDLYKNNFMFFNSIGVKKLDYIFLTHGDLDHSKEAYNYIKYYKVGKVYINNYDLTEHEEKACLNGCIKLRGGDKIKIGKNLFYILNPYFDMNDENDNSLVINFNINNKNILFMGDSSSLIEERIINDYDIGRVDILKVGHHGSKTSTSKEFVSYIKPKYSIISVGKNNRYGHPNKEVLNVLEDSKIYRTDEDGSIMFKIRNNKLQVETCKP